MTSQPNSRELQPAFSDAYGHMARLSLLLNDPEKAEKEIVKARSLDRNNPGFCLLEANIARVRKNYIRYYESLTAALALARSADNNELEDYVQKRVMRTELSH